MTTTNEKAKKSAKSKRTAERISSYIATDLINSGKLIGS